MRQVRTYSLSSSLFNSSTDRTRSTGHTPRHQLQVTSEQHAHTPSYRSSLRASTPTTAVHVLQGQLLQIRASLIMSNQDYIIMMHQLPCNTKLYILTAIKTAICIPAIMTPLCSALQLTLCACLLHETPLVNLIKMTTKLSFTKTVHQISHIYSLTVLSHRNSAGNIFSIFPIQQYQLALRGVS